MVFSKFSLETVFQRGAFIFVLCKLNVPFLYAMAELDLITVVFNLELNVPICVRSLPSKLRKIRHE